jgi:hypothetical protein
MYKVSLFSGQTEYGPSVLPLFGPADAAFEKIAAPSLLPEVSTYIAGLRPRNDAQYVLVNAMGASEYYSSNVNGDYFSEASLIHCPDNWAHNPVLDAVRAKNWPYGFPTFYDAKVFAHHRNKDASRGLGDVELAAWNPHMKRVELVTRVDKDACMRFGGEGTWDKLKTGDAFPDVSMGTKVPFDTCSICLDWVRYEDARATFKPGTHKHPGEAILEEHKRKPIRGLSITRRDYCEHARVQMNHIFPDGRKVWVYNDFPRFFDISYVFIGADKIAKAMLKIASDGKTYHYMGSAELAEKLSGYQEKTASAEPAVKESKQKSSEIKKDVVPSQFAGKAVPFLTRNEEDLPQELLDFLGRMPLERSLSTSSGMGIVLRPREFQRIVLISMRKDGLADELERDGKVFSKTDKVEDVPMSEGAFHPILARLLAPFLEGRSALGPMIEKRVVILGSAEPKEKKAASSHPSELLRKIGAAYNGYRQGLMNLVPSAQTLLEKTAGRKDHGLLKLAGASAEEVFTPLSYEYLSKAFLDELSLGYSSAEVVNISRKQA